MPSALFFQSCRSFGTTPPIKSMQAGAVSPGSRPVSCVRRVVPAAGGIATAGWPGKQCGPSRCPDGFVGGPLRSAFLFPRSAGRHDVVPPPPLGGGTVGYSSVAPP